MALPREVTLRSKRNNRESESIISPVYCHFLTSNKLFHSKRGKPRRHSYAAALLCR